MGKRVFTLLMVVGVVILGACLAEAQDTKVYPCKTKLLFREFGVPVNVVLGAPPSAELPAAFDWGPIMTNNPLGRDIVSEVRDQASCGSCWAFGACAVLEAWINAAFGLSDINLSEEVLVSDCCSAGDCDGGYLSNASDWMVNVGTTTEACWPYTASDGPCAGWCPDPPMAKTTSWDYACTNPFTVNIDQIKTALVNHGPLMCAFDVYSDFYDYSGGVYRHSWGMYEGGHAVLITGYMDNPNQPGGGFFIVKNSWGDDWGPHGGFFAVAYDSNCYFGIESTYYHQVVVNQRKAQQPFAAAFVPQQPPAWLLPSAENVQVQIADTTRFRGLRGRRLFSRFVR